MKITRRDFINGVLAGSGAALLSPRAGQAATGKLQASVDHSWYGYGGVGDYASSHGNTPDVVNTAHRIRDGEFARLPDLPIEEEYDLVIVGGGMAGLGAAWHFKKHAKPGQKCLLLDNHPIFGGEAKENEFLVNGETLIAPQGANGFFVPADAKDPEKVSGDPRYYAELGIPRDLPYGEWAKGIAPLDICRDNFGFTHPLLESKTSIGYFFEKNGEGSWANNIWRNQLSETPLPEKDRKAMLSWYGARTDGLTARDKQAWLDTMSYREFMEKELKLPRTGSQEADVFMAGAYGLGADATSAFVARDVLMPGMLTQEEFNAASSARRNSFPGGNSGFARYFLNAINPAAISGKNTFDDIITGAINFSELDKAGQQVRIRLSSTAVAVQHEGSPGDSSSVRVVYAHGGRTRAVRARGVVMASGGWINRHVVRDMPADIRTAYESFHHAPFLVANVALSNWRFMYDMGITAAKWSKGFGYTANIRQPMHVGRHTPELHPDKPAVLTFYVPFHSPGLPVKAQVTLGRAKLFYTSYAEYEMQIREQLNRMFKSSGFNHETDIQGIILNRWGHAYVVPTPGFFMDTKDKLAPRNIIMKGYGRIAFGHSELEGFQHWGPAADQGRRAVQQILDII